MTSLSKPANEPVRRHGFVAPLRDVEIRQSGNGIDYTLTGYAAIFDSWSEPLYTLGGTFKERISRGAFQPVLKEKPDVRLLFNHDENFPLARTKSGTLDLTEDEQGLRVHARVAPTSFASDLRMAMERGDIDQMSFAFTVAEDTWTENKDTEEITRTIERVDRLFDVSVVTFPAYPDTEATMRELRDAAAAGKITLRTVIGYRETPKADIGAGWDGPGEVARADVEDLRAMCTWYDSNNPDVKSSYKLPHHRADAAHPVVWRGVAGAMQRLMGTDIPQSDMRGCHSHLARHYAQFDREPPGFEDLQRAAEWEAAEQRELPVEAYETRDALLSALKPPTTTHSFEILTNTSTNTLDAPVTNLAVTDTSASAPNRTAGEPVAEPAPDVPAGPDPLTQLRQQARDTVRQEKEAYLRLLRKAAQ